MEVIAGKIVLYSYQSVDGIFVEGVNLILYFVMYIFATYQFGRSMYVHIEANTFWVSCMNAVVVW